MGTDGDVTLDLHVTGATTPGELKKIRLLKKKWLIMLDQAMG